MKPELSIIVCSYWDGLSTRDMDRCLTSLPSCDSGEIEIIAVLDEYPSDIVQSLKDKRGFLRFISSENRIGIAAARRKGIVEARASLIAFIDDDCIAEKNWSNSILQAFRLNEELVGIGGLTLSYKDGGLICDFCDLDQTQREPLRDEKGNIICISTVNAAFRKSALVKTNIFTSAYELAYKAGLYVGFEDYDLTQRLIARFSVTSLAYAPSVVAYHHHRNTWAKRIRQVHWYGESAAFWCWAYAANPKSLEPMSTVPSENRIIDHIIEIYFARKRYINKIKQGFQKGWPYWKAILFGFYCFSLRIAFHIGFYRGTHKIFKRLGPCDADTIGGL